METGTDPKIKIEIWETSADENAKEEFSESCEI